MLPQHAGMDKPLPVDALLTTEEVARLLRVSTRTLEKLIKSGTAPPHFRIGRQRRWSKHEVADWLAGRATAAATPPATQPVTVTQSPHRERR